MESGARFLDSVHPEDHSRVIQSMSRSVSGGGTHEVIYRVVAEGRPARHVASRGSLVETRNGRGVRVAGVCFDITHRMRTEEELRRLNATLEYQRATALSLMRDAEEEMFRAAHAREDVRRHQQFLDSIVENIPSMVFVKDAEELRFLHANKATERLLGRSRDELIGKTEFDLLPEEQAAAGHQRRERGHSLQAGDQHSRAGRRHGRAGQTHPAHAQAADPRRRRRATLPVGNFG